MAPSYMSEKQYINEKSFLYGAFLAAIAYGVVAVLTAICLSMLREQRLPIRHRRAQFAYVVLIFILSTLSMSFQIKMTQAGFLEQRDFNGGTAGYPGPAAYLGKYLDHALPLEFKAWMACLVITNWFCDGVLLWRCMVLYQDNRFWPSFFKFLPTGLLFASFVTGVFHLIQITAPETSSWATANLPFNFTILYGIVALLVNITLTSLITVRLLIHRRRAIRALGSGHGNNFTGIIAMLIESAFLADVFVISFLVPYAMRHWFCNVTIQPLIQVQVIAPLLIIYRVVQGKAWSASTQHAPASGSSGSRTLNPGHHRHSSSQLPFINITGGLDIELGHHTRPSESSSSLPYQKFPRSTPTKFKSEILA